MEPQEKATYPYVNTTGSLTDFPAREETRLACFHTRRGLTSLWKLQRNAEIHVGIGAEIGVSKVKSR